jgi:hypothetical protein
MVTTSYGYRVPEAGDRAKGSLGWYESIEFDIERLNDHSHNGIDSAQLNVNSFSPFTATLAAADWVVSGSGYSQDASTPVGIDDISNFNVKFIMTAPAGMVGEVAYLGYDRLTATTYRVYCNDNTVALTVLFR